MVDIGIEKEIWKANEPRFRHCRILPVWQEAIH